MLVYNLWKKHFPDYAATMRIKSKLGDGADGEVFKLSDGYVVKFSKIIGTKEFLDKEFARLEKIFSYIINTYTRPFVPIYNYRLMEYIPHNLSNSENLEYCLMYYVVMDKLQELSIDEKKAFHTLLCHEDNNKIKDLSESKVSATLHELRKSLIIPFDPIEKFIKNIRLSPISHNDIHVRNIMKVFGGNLDYRLIDLDRCTIKEKNEITI